MFVHGYLFISFTNIYHSLNAQIVMLAERASRWNDIDKDQSHMGFIFQWGRENNWKGIIIMLNFQNK